MQASAPNEIPKPKRKLRYKCKACAEKFLSRNHLKEHVRNLHRPQSLKRRINNAEALAIRSITPCGPLDPREITRIANQLGVSEQYISAVATTKCNLDAEAFPPEHDGAKARNERAKDFSRKINTRKTTYRVTKDQIAETLPKPWTCAYCNTEIDEDTATKDHKTPISRGGKNSISNLQLVCDPCNTIKAELTDEEFVLVTMIARWFGCRSEGMVRKVAISMNICPYHQHNGDTK